MSFKQASSRVEIVLLLSKAQREERRCKFKKHVEMHPEDVFSGRVPDFSPPELTNPLLRFRVSDAHCYDPNEEGKLRSVIQAVGEGRFETSIRTAAKAVLDA